MIKKFTSRKFLACIMGLISGIIIAVGGNTAEGVTTIITSIVAYLIAEGYIDAKAVKQVTEVVNNVCEDEIDMEDLK